MSMFILRILKVASTVEPFLWKTGNYEQIHTGILNAMLIIAQMLGLNYSLSCRHASVREVRLQMILATYFRQEAGGREKRSLMFISLPSVPSVYNLQGC